MACETIVIRKKKRQDAWRKLCWYIRRDKAFLLLSVLPVIYYFIFHYIPIYGILIAFVDYFPTRGVLGSPWVGLQWFRQFFDSYYFWRLLRNTLLLNVYGVIFAFPVPIIFAVLLNDISQVRFKKFVQTISYMPHFISEVVIVGMLFTFFSANSGVVNIILNKLGYDTVQFMSQPGWFRPLYIGSNIWSSFGFSSIVYIAAITGIDMELYDAASIDGATRFQKVLHITIPSIMPTIVTLLLLRLGNMMSVGYQKIVLMYSQATYETADVISTFVYRSGIVSGNYGYATAVSLFNSIINLILLVAFNKISRAVSDISLW